MITLALPDKAFEKAFELVMRLLPYLAVCAVLYGCYWLGGQHERAEWEQRAAKQTIEAQEALAAVIAERDAAKNKAQQTITVEVTRYVDKIIRLPGPTVIRDRLVGLCDQGGTSLASGLQLADSPAGNDGLALGDAGNRPADAPGVTLAGLAADLRTAQTNKGRQALCVATLDAIYAANPQASSAASSP